LRAEKICYGEPQIITSFLAGVRDVDNVTLLIPAAMKEICGNQLPVPELKQNETACIYAAEHRGLRASGE
jgi:hypothetical protein